MLTSWVPIAGKQTLNSVTRKSTNARKDSNCLALSHYGVNGCLEILDENPIWWETKSLVVIKYLMGMNKGTWREKVSHGREESTRKQVLGIVKHILSSLHFVSFLWWEELIIILFLVFTWIGQIKIKLRSKIISILKSWDNKALRNGKMII